MDAARAARKEGMTLFLRRINSFMQTYWPLIFGIIDITFLTIWFSWTMGSVPDPFSWAAFDRAAALDPTFQWFRGTFTVYGLSRIAMMFIACRKEGIPIFR